MSGKLEPFEKMLRRVADGSERAARQLIEQHHDRIYQVIRRRLNRELRAKFDSQDFFQAVWASFFADRQMIATFQEPEKLVAYLGAVAANKVVEENRRRFATMKHDITRERAIDHSHTFSGQPLLDNKATPSEVAIAREEIDRLVEGQPPVNRKIVQLKARGLTYKEISEQVGMAERSVRRIMRKLIRQQAK